MTDQDIEREIERSRKYLHALIDVRFSMAIKHTAYKRRKAWDAEAKKYYQRWEHEPVDPQTYYLWRSRDEFEMEPDKEFIEAVRIHDDGTWTWQPTAGPGHIYRDVVLWRHFCTKHGHRHSVTPWVALVPYWFKPKERWA